jgi:hypothetical protein
MSELLAVVQRSSEILLVQRRELAELFGFETRNKYAIEANGAQIGFAAEQGKSGWAFLGRMLAGHWRTFEVHFFDAARQLVLRAVHPFRFFLQRLEVSRADGRALGIVQQRWSVLSKRFDVLDASGRLLLTVSSPIWRPWSFAFERQGRALARVEKKWAGISGQSWWMQCRDAPSPSSSSAAGQRPAASRTDARTVVLSGLRPAACAARTNSAAVRHCCWTPSTSARKAFAISSTERRCGPVFHPADPNCRDGRAGVRHVHELAAQISADSETPDRATPWALQPRPEGDRARRGDAPRRATPAASSSTRPVTKAHPFDFLLSEGNEGEGCNLSQSRAPANAWWRSAALAYFARRARRELRHLLKPKCTGQ